MNTSVFASSSLSTMIVSHGTQGPAGPPGREGPPGPAFQSGDAVGFSFNADRTVSITYANGAVNTMPFNGVIDGGKF